MTPTKLPSGSWRVLVYLKTEDGRTIRKSVTAKTKSECLKKAMELKEVKPQCRPETLREIVQKYIELSELLSPTTLRSYDVILRYAFTDIMDTPVETLTDSRLQSAINLESKRINEHTGRTLSAKTVANEYQLISAALKTICGKSFTVRLPKRQHKNSTLPEPKAVMDAVKGTSIELPCLLALWCGLRMSEIRGLKFSDLKGTTLEINRVKVVVNQMDIVKDLAKTDSSIRKVQIPKQIASLIKRSMSERKADIEPVSALESDFIVLDSYASISHKFQRLMTKANLDITFHGLRHLYASICLNILKLPPKVVQLTGGWGYQSSVMDNVYSQGFDESFALATNIRDEYFSSLL